MRLRLVLAMAALALPALSVAAQDVVLGGWSLPEGAVVQSVSSSSLRAEFRGSGAVLPVKSETSEVSTTTIDRVAGGRLERAVQRLDKLRETTHVAGNLVPSSPDSRLGRAVSIERGPAGWHHAALGWTPDDEAQAALDDGGSLDDAEYPRRPVAVGETVVVPDSALRVVYPDATAGPHRLTVRLDSVGTFQGGPAAFVTQHVSVVENVEGGTMRMEMDAQIVRRLDWLLDVRTVWAGEVTFTYTDSVVEGTMRWESEQTVELPEAER